MFELLNLFCMLDVKTHFCNETDNHIRFFGDLYSIG